MKDVKRSISLPGYVKAALSRLEGSGYFAYVVGGAVRDLVMGKTPSDYDIATSARPEEIKDVFSGERYLTVGEKHGTITVFLAGHALEVTTFRSDGEYKDKRRPESVVFVSDLFSDLSRRDFTMNAIAYREEEGIFDPFGGVLDIEKKCIRAVGDPKTRFSEDALRILRALRFASAIGFSIEKNSKEALLELAPTLREISAERILSELKVLLCAEGAEQVLREYHEVFFVVLPELSPSFGFEQRNPYHSSDVWEHTLKAVGFAEGEFILRFALLFHDAGKPESFTLDENGVGHFYHHQAAGATLARAAMQRLKFDRLSAERIEKLILYHDMKIEPTKSGVLRALYILGEEDIGTILELKEADTLAKSEESRDDLLELQKIEQIVQELLDEGAAYKIRDLKINGEDLLGLGVPRGRKIGAALKRLLFLVMDGEIQNERRALLKKAESPGFWEELSV